MTESYAGSNADSVPHESRGETILGSIRAYWVGVVCCIAGFLFGYDAGIVGGVLEFTSFQNDFKFEKKHLARTNSLTVSTQQAGAFAACFIVFPIAKRFGRKWPLFCASMLFCIGCIIQTIPSGSLGVFYAGRFIAGLGLGGATVIVPMYTSEMAPANIRGRIGCFFQWFFTIGIFMSSWVNYAVKKHYINETRQWQIPIALQLVPAGLLGLGQLTLAESFRWYLSQNRIAEAKVSFEWVRGRLVDNPHNPLSVVLCNEWTSVQQAMNHARTTTYDFKYKELLKPAYAKRLFLSFLVFTCQQSTGATSLAYFGPQYFTKIAGGSAELSLTFTGIYGAVKILFCGLFVFFVAERVGRRVALTAGAAGMAVFQIITAVLVRCEPDASQNKNGPTAANIATVIMIYAFVACYNCSWGCLPWPYVAEIFPTRIREPGVALGVCSQWLWNFVYTLTTPYMIQNIGWGTFLFWGATNVAIVFVGLFILKETRGMSLEHINKDLDQIRNPDQARANHQPGHRANTSSIELTPTAPTAAESKSGFRTSFNGGYRTLD